MYVLCALLEPLLDCLCQLLELVQQPDMDELRAILLSTDASGRSKLG